MYRLLVVLHQKALGPGRIDGASQPLDLLFHLSMLAAFADALEVRLDLTLELETVTPRAALEGVLDDIAAELAQWDIWLAMARDKDRGRRGPARQAGARAKTQSETIEELPKQCFVALMGRGGTIARPIGARLGSDSPSVDDTRCRRA